MKRFSLLLALAGCASAPSPPPPLQDPVQAPVELQSCPPGKAPPLPPRTPRTTEQIAAWSVRVQHAWLVTEHARAECAARLEQLNRSHNPKETPDE